METNPVKSSDNIVKESTRYGWEEKHMIDMRRAGKLSRFQGKFKSWISCMEINDLTVA